jgi:hypothetical protein
MGKGRVAWNRVLGMGQQEGYYNPYQNTVYKEAPPEMVKGIVVSGKSGHWSKDCPESRKFQFACRNCGQKGHKVVQCQAPKGGGKGKGFIEVNDGGQWA